MVELRLLASPRHVPPRSPISRMRHRHRRSSSACLDASCAARGRENASGSRTLPCCGAGGCPATRLERRAVPPSAVKLAQRTVHTVLPADIEHPAEGLADGANPQIPIEDEQRRGYGIEEDRDDPPHPPSVFALPVGVQTEQRQQVDLRVEIKRRRTIHVNPLPDHARPHHHGQDANQSTEEKAVRRWGTREAARRTAPGHLSIGKCGCGLCNIAHSGGGSGRSSPGAWSCRMTLRSELCTSMPPL